VEDGCCKGDGRLEVLGKASVTSRHAKVCSTKHRRSERPQPARLSPCAAQPEVALWDGLRSGIAFHFSGGSVRRLSYKP
jgi:hypothetical protein